MSQMPMQQAETYVSDTILSSTYTKLAADITCSKYGRVATINIYGFKNLATGDNPNIFKVPDGFLPDNNYYIFLIPGGATSVLLYRIFINSSTGYGSVYVYNSTQFQSNITASITYITK